MYISAQHVGSVAHPDSSFLRLAIGASRKHDEFSYFQYDHRLIIDGIAAALYRAIPHQVDIKWKNDEWVLAFDYSPSWEKTIEGVLRSHRLTNFQWTYDDYLGCKTDQYFIDRVGSQND